VLPSTHRSSAQLVAALVDGRTADLPLLCVNRLTAAATILNPAMAQLISRLERSTRQPVWMSGSGSTVYILCRSEPHMQQLRRQLLEERIPSWMLRV
jgi:4-diphosphocytidyl-2C-methyl-D-erythritol kinase